MEDQKIIIMVKLYRDTSKQSITKHLTNRHILSKAADFLV